ncbi:UNVERIFIED_ORG: hypothetical protein DFO82_2607 [Idiomarina abyssalis]|uniref:hypothetical protein n=1 Tax=unclassified Idiomarina TaxID=2614829 RepID=UPI000E0FEE68|nr:hypothetical protein [Idiomarina sp. 017G]TDO45550.1 hypothetical protein DEU30_11212 [Idiomarina sp. 017G]
MQNNLKLQEETKLEQFRSVMQMAAMALKSAMIINGGAAISLLTFLGNVNVASGMDYFTCALKYYISGVTLAALATGVSYLAQFRYLHEVRNPQGMKIGKYITLLTVIIVLASYLAFLVGGLQASSGFDSRV